MRIGFIGTGTISAAVIEGLQSLPDAPEVVVSPRSEATSLALAAKFKRVSRAQSNTEVATADIVFLGMRPMHLDEAMAGIDFKTGQIVARLASSIVATVMATSLRCPVTSVVSIRVWRCKPRARSCSEACASCIWWFCRRQACKPTC